MRKVVLGMQVSVDGYVGGPGGELDWAFANFDEELMRSSAEVLSRIDTFLMGRRNYEEQAATWPNQSGPIADVMNKATKIVFSGTLDHVEWSNSRLATASPAEEIAALRAQPGGLIGVAGGASLARSLAEQGLIDEYRLMVHPVALGAGLPLFAGPTRLELLDTVRLGSGVLVNTYRPV